MEPNANRIVEPEVLKPRSPNSEYKKQDEQVRDLYFLDSDPVFAVQDGILFRCSQSMDTEYSVAYKVDLTSL